jgi:hypothetical protein
MDLVRSGHVAVPALSGTGGAGGGLVRADRTAHPFYDLPRGDPGEPGGPWDPVLALFSLPEAFRLAQRIMPYLRWEGGIGCCVAVPGPDL